MARKRKKEFTPEEWVVESQKRWRRTRIILYSWITIFTFFTIWSVSAIRNQSDATRGLAAKSRNLTAQNSLRITEIQKSRVVSCLATYQGMNDFLSIALGGKIVNGKVVPPKKVKLLPKQREVLATLRARFSEKQCLKQTKPIVKKKKKG